MTGSAQPVVAYPPSPGKADGLSTAQLVSRLAEELSRLARDEFQLARMQFQRNWKRAGLGAGGPEQPRPSARGQRVRCPRTANRGRRTEDGRCTASRAAVNL